MIDPLPREQLTRDDVEMLREFGVAYHDPRLKALVLAWLDALKKPAPPKLQTASHAMAIAIA